MNKAAWRLCRAALPWARCSPVWCDFTSFLSKLKPDAIATSVTIYFRWGSASQRGASAAVSSAVRAPRAPEHCGWGLRGPVPYNQRDTRDLRSRTKAVPGGAISYRAGHHLLQSSSASRLTAGAAGFLTLIQLSVRPET